MCFTEKDHSPSIEEYIKDKKSRWGNNWKFWIEWNLRGYETHG
jgi:hypothetical protein